MSACELLIALGDAPKPIAELHRIDDAQIAVRAIQGIAIGMLVIGGGMIAPVASSVRRAASSRR